MEISVKEMDEDGDDTLKKVPGHPTDEAKQHGHTPNPNGRHFKITVSSIPASHHKIFSIAASTPMIYHYLYH
jgi:hypothetical protein